MAQKTERRLTCCGTKRGSKRGGASSARMLVLTVMAGSNVYGYLATQRLLPS